MNPRIQHLDKYVTARPIQPDVSVASPPAMPEGLARRSSGAMRSLLALAFMATAAHAQVDISQAPCAYPNGVLAAPNYFSFAGTVPAGKELNAHRLDAHSDTLGAGGQSRVAGSVLSGSGYAFRLTKDGNIFIGDLSLDQYIDARVHAALGH